MAPKRNKYTIKAVNLEEGLPAQQLNAIDANPGVAPCLVGWSMHYDYLLDEETLRNSLSRAVAAYPSLTGRIKPRVTARGDGRPLSKHQLVFNNAGLKFVVQHMSSSSELPSNQSPALVKRSAFSFLGGKSAFPKGFEYIKVNAMLRGKEPLMKVRLTCFPPDKDHPWGVHCIVSITASHIAVDGFSLMSFFKTWTQLYQQLQAGRDPSPVPLAPNERSWLTMAGYQQTCTHQQIKVVKVGQEPEPKAHPAASIEGNDDARRPDQIQKRGVAGGPPGPCTLRSRPPLHHVVPTTDDMDVVGHTGHGPRQPLGDLSSTASGFALIHKDPLKLTRPREYPLLKSVKLVHQAWRGLNQEESKLNTRARTLSVEVLHLPGPTMKALKASASRLCGPEEFTSSNDAVAGLVWVLMCQLRQRPLPGQRREGAKVMQSGFGLAVDLRSNCGDLLPSNYFGNASWAIHVASCDDEGNPVENPSDELQEPWRPDMSSGDWESLCQREGLLEQSLCVASLRIRRWLTWYRGQSSNGKDLVDTIEVLHRGTLGSKLERLGGLLTYTDAFLTSWQFPIWDGMDWGQGAPTTFQGVIHPQPVWHGMVLPDKEGGGFYLSLTVPHDMVNRLHNSPVIHTLVPGARFL